MLQKRTFYILFICLAVLAKVLLVTVIIFSIVISCRPQTRSCSLGEAGAGWRGEMQTDRVFNARICAIK